MTQNYCVRCAGVAVGTDKALLNLFRSIASPYTWARVYDLLIGCAQTPADAATRFAIRRTTGVGTEGSGFVPVNLNPEGPPSQSDAGIGPFSAEPTKTADSYLLQITMNQRACVRWVSAPGSELILPATQNNGLCLNSESSTVTTGHDACILFAE